MVRPARIADLLSKALLYLRHFTEEIGAEKGAMNLLELDRFDAIYGVDVLKQFINCKKIHVYGFSRGGLMAIWTAILRDDIASVVTWAGVSDTAATYWERVDWSRGYERIIGGTPNKVPERYEDRTPLYDVDEIDAPVFNHTMVRVTRMSI